MKMKIAAVMTAAALVMAFGLGACGKEETVPEAAPEAAASSAESVEEPAEEAVEEPAEEPEEEAAAPAEEPAAEPEEEAPEEPAEEPAGEPAEEPAPQGAAYGYAGDDPVEMAVYRYMAEEVSGYFDEADASIPIVTIVAEDSREDEVLVYGDFWVMNYKIEGDTLKCVSGGNYPGVMHLAPEGEGYAVSSMDVVADGAGSDESAREIFGDHYEEFVRVHSDDAAREELRRATISDYVSLNGLSVTKYQDEGWDPVELSD